METFCLPIHEVHERFTRSEIYMMAWRSQEQHHHMMERMDDIKKPKGEAPQRQGRRSRYGADDIIPEGLPDHFFNKNGEVDLSQVTGKEAMQYMSSIGMHFPIMMTGRPNPSPRKTNG